MSQLGRESQRQSPHPHGLAGSALAFRNLVLELGSWRLVAPWCLGFTDPSYLGDTSDLSPSNELHSPSSLLLRNKGGLWVLGYSGEAQSPPEDHSGRMPF